MVASEKSDKCVLSHEYISDLKKFLSFYLALFPVKVDDKPWRKATIRSRLPVAETQTTITPKTPSTSQQQQASPVTKSQADGPATPSSTSWAGPTTSATSGQNPYDHAKRPFLKYIRGLGPPTPRQRSSKHGVEPRSSHATSSGMAPVWSDHENDNDNDDDHSSISSEMISYSSMDSMDVSDDDISLSLPVDDYTHHPETDPNFWNLLPFIPTNFVNDAEENANNNLRSLLGSPGTSNPTTPSSAAANNALYYLDPQLKNFSFGDPSKPNDFRFVLDHRFYLRALAQLLVERDEVGVEDSIHDDKNIIKKGPLKKKYVGVVKVKYLELRKGNLVYYGDGDGEGRTTVHLRSATAVCHVVDGVSNAEHGDNNTTDNPNTTGSALSPTAMVEATAALSAGLTSAVNATTSAASTIAGGTSYTPGFEFHLWVEGKRYVWLANSKNEQKSWVRAINSAMIGDNINDQSWGMTMITANDDLGGAHEDSLASYLALKSKLSDCVTIKEYCDTILSLVQSSTTPPEVPALQVPLKLILESIPKDAMSPLAKKKGKSQQQRVKSSIAEFWKNMGKFDFAINDHIIDRESPSAAERTIGALVRCILDFDRSFAEDGAVDQFAMPPLSETPGQSAREKPQQSKRSETDRITELEAVSYARTILMMILKSKTEPVVELTVENLCNREGLVNVVAVDPSSSLSTSSETLHIDVSFAGDDVVDHADDSMLSDEASGWVMVRRSKYNTWKKRFCVFSEGVFSYFENAKPRPHGLRGQLLLYGAHLSVVEDEKERTKEDSGLFILRLATKGQDRERQFGFKTEDEYLEWKEAIQHVVDTCNLDKQSEAGDNDTDGVNTHFGDRGSTNKKSKGIIAGGTKLVSYAADGAKKGGTKVVKGAAGAVKGGTRVVKGAAGEGVKLGTKVVKGAAGGLRGATNLVFRTIRITKRGSKKGESTRSIRKSPSIQFLMENSRSDKTGKREPTVQCVIQTTKDFLLRSADPSAGEEGELV